MATTAAYQTFRRVYSNPEDEQRRAAFSSRRVVYALRWAYYQNSAFEDLANWSQYKGAHRLYRFTRSIYNPTARLIDFYTGALYPGRLSAEPDKPSAIPLNEATPQALRTAIAEVWRASNWQSNKSVMVRWAASLGEMLVEIIDDVERGQVYLQNTWPGMVDDLDLDNMGNVKAYALEYDALDADEKPYKYRKEVDSSGFREFHDDKQVSSYPNPYGFVPACWVVHRNEGGMYGAPAMRHISKWDELNGLASHTHDQIHKQLKAPLLLAGTKFSAYSEQAKAGASEDNKTMQESIDIIQGSADATLQTMQFAGIELLIPYMEKLLGEIEADHPELTFYQQLREMSQVTGPAAQRLMGDVQALVMDAQASYDQQLIKAFQMATAIGGWRLSQRDWGASVNRQQEAYRGFDLESYRRGDLEFSIDERPLIPVTEHEQLELDRMKLALESDRRGLNEQNQPAAIAGRLRGARVAA
jgi:hypothetical protein